MLQSMLNSLYGTWYKELLLKKKEAPLTALQRQFKELFFEEKIDPAPGSSTPI